MTEKERVIFAYPDAFCVNDRGLYQILRPCIQTSGSPFANEYLSAQHLTEDLAWHFAAVRVRLKDRAMARIETNRALVLESYPKAWCAHLRGDYYQIQRPRLGDDKPSNLDYVTLSGRFSDEVLAWQDAGRRLERKSHEGFGRNATPTHSSRTQTDGTIAL
jgi:hypothetical protein